MSSYDAASPLTDYDVRGCAQLVGMSVGQVVVRHVGHAASHLCQRPHPFWVTGHATALP